MNHCPAPLCPSCGRLLHLGVVPALIAADNMQPSTVPAKAFTLRTAVILLLAAVVGVGAAGLTWLSFSDGPQSALTGITGFGAAFTFFDRHVRY